MLIYQRTLLLFLMMVALCKCMPVKKINRSTCSFYKSKKSRVYSFESETERWIYISDSLIKISNKEGGYNISYAVKPHCKKEGQEWYNTLDDTWRFHINKEKMIIEMMELKNGVPLKPCNRRYYDLEYMTMDPITCMYVINHLMI